VPDEPAVHQQAIGSGIAQAGPGGTAMVVSYQYVPPQPVDDASIAAATQRLAELPLAAVPEPDALPAHSRMLLSPNPIFVGRTDDMKKLATTVTAGGGGAGSRVAALAGLGGVGKTQLACEFVHRYGRWFAGGVFWLSFADPSAIAAEVAACGGPGGLDLRPDFPTLDLEDRVRLVMAAWQSGLPRLLVFDNCEEEALLAQWRPPTGGCRVLVTTRREAWDLALGVEVLRLGVLRRKEGIELLHRHRPDLPADDAGLQALAEELGDLPLALHLAGSFLGRYRSALDPSAYLAQLRQSDPLAHRSLQGSGISPTGHIQNVARTFAVSYTRLEPADSVDELALALLARAAWLAPGESIPRDLLLATVDLDRDDLDAALRAEDALGRLVELGLVETHPAAVRLHRLVAAFVRAQPGTDQAQAAVEQTLADTFDKYDESGDLVAGAALEPHLRAVADAALRRVDPSALRLGNVLGNYLRRSGDFAGAVHYLEQALTIHETLEGKGHPRTARSLNDLGYAFLFKGDHRRAKVYLERALPLWKQSRDDANRAATLDNLGQLASSEGNAVDARRYYARALRLRERVLGLAHPRTTISMHNLGLLLMQSGEFDEAGKCLERALEVRLQVLGPDHVYTAISLRTVGELHFQRGNLTSTRDCFERALPVFERLRGTTHPTVLAVRSALLALADEQGDRARADQLREELTALRGQMLQGGGPEAATALNNLGYSLWVRGDYVAASRNYQDALILEEQAEGPFSPALVTILNNLGMVRERQADYTGAAAYYQRALAIQERAGQLHSGLTGRILNNYGVTLRLLGHVSEAQARLDEALAIRRRTLGDAHPDTGITLLNLGMLRQAQDDLTGALKLVEDALGICRQRGGDSHPNVARCLNDLGVLLAAHGQLRRAGECLRQALSIRRRALALRHPDTAETLVNLGLLASREHDDESARAYLEEALATYEYRLGTDNPRARAVLDHLDALGPRNANHDANQPRMGPSEQEPEDA
jgi:tetratricopeptide (TPR) repeat protein